MRRAGLTLIEVLVIIAILAMLTSVALPALLMARDAADRIRCAAQMREVGMAIHGFVSAKGRLPAGTNGPRSQQPRLGWMAQVLPYFDQAELWNKTQVAFQSQRSPFVNPPHVPLNVTLQGIICPADTRKLEAQMTERGFSVAFSCYLGVSGDELPSKSGVLFCESTVTMQDITDGLSHTLMNGERPPSGNLLLGWWYAGTGTNGEGDGDHHLTSQYPNRQGARGFRPGRANDLSDAEHFWSFHSGGGNFVCADGAVHFLHYASAKILPRLSTRNGGEASEMP